MRAIRFAAAAAIAAVVSSVSAESAEPACCDEALPTIIYGAPPVPYAPPPSGYVLDPSDSRGPIYVVNQGPLYSGPGIYSYAVPTYSEGGYAYANPYPYVSGRFGGHMSWRDAAPYVGREADSYPVREITVIAGAGRPYGPHPRHAYGYRPSPNARVIRVPSQAQ
jgi:hypothetical protein